MNPIYFSATWLLTAHMFSATWLPTAHMLSTTWLPTAYMLSILGFDAFISFNLLVFL